MLAREHVTNWPAAEQALEAVHRRLHQQVVALARALIAAQADDAAGITAGGVLRKHQFGERGGVEQPEVDALTGERMHDVRGIADQGQPRLHVVLRVLEA